MKFVEGVGGLAEVGRRSESAYTRRVKTEEEQKEGKERISEKMTKDERKRMLCQ